MEEIVDSGRKKFDLENKIEVYPGIFSWNEKAYILVKEGEHYWIPRNRMDIMVKECRGKLDEIVKYYKPRKFKPKDPNKPKVQRKRFLEYSPASNSDKKTSTETWIHPNFIDKLDGHKYNSSGFRIS